MRVCWKCKDFVCCAIAKKKVEEKKETVTPVLARMESVTVVEDRCAMNPLFRASGLLTVLQDAKGRSASAVIPRSVPGDYAHAGNLRSLEKTTSSRPLDTDCVEPYGYP